MKKLSVIILAFNEEKNIERCIHSVKNVADEIIVLDSFSTDQTPEIAGQMGCTVKQVVYDGYISQKNKGIKLATNDFVLLLDADEALSEELAVSVLQAKTAGGGDAYIMNRSNFFCGKFIKHGLWYPDKKLRLFNRNSVTCTGLDPHDKMLVKPGTVVTKLKGDLLHYSFAAYAEYYERNDAISSIAAKALFEAGIKKPGYKIVLSPLWAFINGYLLKLGFIDGKNGLIIAVNTAKQSFFKYYKLKQLHKQAYNNVAWEH